MENLNKYQNGKIYKITDNAYTECYIGSTTQALCNRMADHRKCYNSYKRGTSHSVTVYKLFDKYGLENCKIELIADVPCERKEQLSRIEGEYIRKHKCINRKVEGRTNKEYREENKQEIAEKKREYRKANEETIKEKKKSEYEAHRDKYIERSKTHYALNKEHHLQLCKERYEDKKDLINELRREKLQCVHCGLTLNRGCLSKHIKRKHPESINI